jgi:hypothetical protein
MGIADILKAIQYNRARRIGEQDTGEDPFTQPEQNVPLSVPNEEDPRFIRGNIKNIDSQIAATPGAVDPSFEELMGTFDTSKQDAYNALLAQKPTRESPNFARRLVAAGIGLGSKNPLKDEEEVMYAPHIRAMEDWSKQVEPAYRSAQLENTANANERQARTSTINAKNAADKLLAHEREVNAQIESKEKIARDKLALQQEVARGAKVSFENGHAIVTRLDGTVYEAPVDLTNYSALEIAQLTANAAQKRTETQVQGAKDVAGIGATSRENVAETGVANRELFNVPIDPADPSKGTVFKRYNSVTNQMETVKDKDTGQPSPGADRPGTGGSGSKGLKQPVNIEAIKTQAQETINAINELVNDKGEFTPEAKAFYGPSAAMGIDKLPLNSLARVGAVRHRRVAGQLIIGLISEMKNQSKTGATGFGQLSVRELGVIEQAASGMDPILPEETKKELIRIRDKFKLILQPPNSETPTVTEPKSKIQQAIKEAAEGK